MIIKIRLTYFILFLIAVTPKSNGQELTSRYLTEQQMQPSIYGVRWTLGNAYNLLPAQRNQQQFLLLFNSDTSLNSNTYVTFGKSSYNCRGTQYSLDQFLTFQYSCIINQKPTTQSYSIRMGSLDLTGSYDQYHINSYNEITLYEGLLRFEGLGQSIAMMGRVQVIQEINNNVLKIVEDENVSIVVISEIIPRINGNNFKDILIYLQPITSRAFTIPISIDNFGKDTFWSTVLFPAYFKQSDNIQAYVFSSFKIRVLCLGQQKSQQIINPLKQRLSNLSEEDFLTVTLSMYSISESHKQALSSLLNLNIHLNLIQQTDNYKQSKICYDITNEGKQCIYQINEGYITPQRNDIGIVTSKITKNNATYQWKHYQNAQQPKSIILWQQTVIQDTRQDNSIDINVSAFRKILITAQILTFLFLVSLILLAYIRYRKSITNTNNQVHMQLVQEIVNGAQPRQLPVNL